MSWQRLYLDGEGNAWGWPYLTGRDGRPGYLGLGFIDDPWTEEQIVAVYGGPLVPLVRGDGSNLDPDVVEAQWRQYARMVVEADAQGLTRPWPPHSPMPAWWPLPES